MVKFNSKVKIWEPRNKIRNQEEKWERRNAINFFRKIENYIYEYVIQKRRSYKWKWGNPNEGPENNIVWIITENDYTVEIAIDTSKINLRNYQWNYRLFDWIIL